jgi:hypothetical protein
MDSINDLSMFSLVIKMGGFWTNFNSWNLLLTCFAMNKLKYDFYKTWRPLRGAKIINLKGSKARGSS